MLYKTAILDDDKFFVDYLEEIVMLYNSVNKEQYIVTKYTSSFLFLEDLENGILYDVYLLDIKMPYLTGMDIAGKLREITDAVIIFVTAYKRYALDGYKYGVFRYIHKTDVKNELILALGDVTKRLSLQEGKYLLVDTTRFKGKIHFKDIVYMYKKSKDTIFVMVGTNHTIKLRKSLEEVFKSLPNEEFCYIDRCFIVNLQHIQGVETATRQLQLDNGQMLNISKSRLQEIKDTITLYWSNNI